MKRKFVVGKQGMPIHSAPALSAGSGGFKMDHDALIKRLRDPFQHLQGMPFVICILSSYYRPGNIIMKRALRGQAGGDGEAEADGQEI